MFSPSKPYRNMLVTEVDCAIAPAMKAEATANE